MDQGYHVAVVGITGVVGQQILNILETENFPIASLTPLASSRSAGKKVTFNNQEWTIKEAQPEAFTGIDIALFSAGGSVSRKLAQEAVKRGAVVVDNTSAFRMDPEIPLVVPEVNEEDLHGHPGIIANPNCSTIQMVLAMDAIRQSFGLQQVVVSTYQAVSGAGVKAVQDMKDQSRAMLDGETYEATSMPAHENAHHYPIAFNTVPQIDTFQENGYTFEEMKMINETKKILHDNDLPVAATCVRLPVETGHGESVFFRVNRADISVKDVKKSLFEAKGITVQDDPEEQLYPTPLHAAGHKDVFVGRIRKDLDDSRGFHIWIVSDNLLKGAAWNTVQIAESLIHRGLLNKESKVFS